MILNKILGNVDDIEGLNNLHIEKLALESDELLKRIIRVTSDHGNEYGISLPKGSELKDGDILLKDSKSVTIVCVKNEDVLVIVPRDIDEMGIVAHSLGNKHLPVQIEDGKIVIQYDYVVERQLDEDEIEFTREVLKLKKAFRHVDHSH